MLSSVTQRDMNEGNEAVPPHVSQSQGGLQAAGEEAAVVHSLQSAQQKVGFLRMSIRSVRMLRDCCLVHAI